MSFRVRLFVSAIASVTVVLGIVMATAWVRVMELETSRLNTRLCSEAARVAREDFTSRELRDIEADIARKLGLSGSTYLLVQQTSPQGKTGFQTEPWSQTVPEVIGAGRGNLRTRLRHRHLRVLEQLPHRWISAHRQCASLPDVKSHPSSTATGSGKLRAFPKVMQWVRSPPIWKHHRLR